MKRKIKYHNIIYGLIDPRNGQLRYIGLSAKGLERAREHMEPYYLKNDKSHKANWVRNLIKVGLKYEILEFAPY